MELNELRRIAVDALETPSDVPRHERDLVVPAEILIRLIDDYNSKMPAPSEDICPMCGEPTCDCAEELNGDTSFGAYLGDDEVSL